MPGLPEEKLHITGFMKRLQVQTAWEAVGSNLFPAPVVTKEEDEEGMVEEHRMLPLTAHRPQEDHVPHVGTSSAPAAVLMHRSSQSRDYEKAKGDPDLGQMWRWYSCATLSMDEQHMQRRFCLQNDCAFGHPKLFRRSMGFHPPQLLCTCKVGVVNQCPCAVLKTTN